MGIDFRTGVEPAGDPRERGSSDGIILRATGIRKIYRTAAGSVDALRSVDVDVRRGEFLAVMGPSGSGKTTLVNCLSGLDDIDEGSVSIEGENIHRMPDAERTRHRAAHMGFIFQSFNLIPVFTAAENVELPLLLSGRSPSEANMRALATLERVGLGHRTGHRPNELSGGEQQRVTIARALAGQPTIVWADEPTGNLDTESAESILRLLGELRNEGLTVVMVTHDEGIGGSADRVLRMRDGAIEQDLRAGSSTGVGA